MTSAHFAAALRTNEFLRYAVEETLAGRAQRLKGYAIAVDVFGRPPDFNASTDPLVRVEAGRLRRRLADYYASEGRRNPVRMELPVGGYVPRFSRAPIAGRDLFGLPRARWAVVAGVLLALGAMAVLPIVFRTDEGREAAATLGIDAETARTPAPRIAVAKFANLTGDPALDDFAAGLTEETFIRLNDFGLRVILRRAHAGDDTSRDALRESEARYLLTGAVRREGGLLRVSLRLVESASSAQVWGVSFDEELRPDEVVSIQERIGTRIAAILRNPFGPMYEREIGKIAELPLGKLDSYGCVLQFRAYAQSLDPAAHDRSRRCFLRVYMDEPQRAQIWAGLALVYQHELWYGYNPQKNLGDPLRRAYDAAQTALDLDDQNLLANLAMASVRYSSGDEQGFRLAAGRAVALAKNPSTYAQIGLLMTLSGDTERGRALLTRAFAAEPEIPSWYHVAYSFNALRQDEYRQALDWGLKANAPHWFAAPMTVAAAAGLAGRVDIAERAIERLRAADPDFERTGRRRLEGWIRDRELVARITEGLQAAGLDLCPLSSGTDGCSDTISDVSPGGVGR